VALHVLDLTLGVLMFGESSCVQRWVAFKRLHAAIITRMHDAKEQR